MECDSFFPLSLTVLVIGLCICFKVIPAEDTGEILQNLTASLNGNDSVVAELLESGDYNALGTVVGVISSLLNADSNAPASDGNATSSSNETALNATAAREASANATVQRMEVC